MRIIPLLRFSLLALISTLMLACSSGGGYNPTVFEYTYHPEKVAAKPISKVVVASVNLGAPPPSYLRKSDVQIRAKVKKYLADNGYEVLPNYHFENAWMQATRSHGDVYDPSTGRINTNAWRGAMMTMAEQIRSKTDADAIVFADVIEHPITHSHSSRHQARWFGVARNLSTRGTGGVPVGFNWNQQTKGASLSVAIYDKDLKLILSNRGGLDTLYELNLKKADPNFVRRKKILQKDAFIQEGIKIAFHPLITMANYPGNQ